MFFKGVSILQEVKINRSIKALWYITNKNILYKARVALYRFLAIFLFAMPMLGRISSIVF